MHKGVLKIITKDTCFDFKCVTFCLLAAVPGISSETVCTLSFLTQALHSAPESSWKVLLFW